MSGGSLQFRVLGPARLIDAGGESVSSIPSSPKRLALFTYLCAAPGLVGRDALAGLLWPEDDQDHARNALNQLLHRIRRDVGRDALQSRGAELIGVDRERVWCDLAAFDAALEARRLENAIELYGGDVLKGFYLSGVPAFERWLENRRESCRNRAVKACRELANGVADTEPAEAVRWLRRALEIAPNREVLLRELLVGLDALGDRAGAVKAYADFAHRLERDLETRPSPETVALMEKIAGREVARGVPRLQPVPEAEVASPPTPSPSAVERESEVEPRREARSFASVLQPLSVGPAIAGALLVAAVGFTTFALVRGTPEVDAAADAAAELRDDVVLVVPFEATGVDIEYLSEGMVELLGTALDGNGVPRAVESGVAMSAWQQLAEGRSMSPDVLLELGRATGAARIIRGTAVSTSDGVLFTAELVDARTGRILSTDSRQTKLEGPDGSALWSAAAGLAARLLAGSVEGGRLVVEAPAPRLDALKEYLAGRAAYRAGRATAALEHYRRALERDSTFAYAALGMLEVSQWPSAALAFNEARELVYPLQQRLTRRDRVYMRALGGPNYPAASTGADFEKALAEARHLLPYRAEVHFETADDLFHSRTRLEDAEAGFRHALELDPGFSVALQHLFLKALGTGDLDEAERLATRYRNEFPEADHVRSIDWSLARARKDDEAIRDFWSRPEELSNAVLTDAFLWTYALGFPIEDARRVLAEAVRRGDRPHGFLMYYFYFTHLNAGRPSEAIEAHGGRPNADMDPIAAALYSVGDPVFASAWADSLARVQNEPLTGDKWQLAEQAHGTCMLEQWRLWRGEGRRTLARSLRRIHEAQRRAPEVEGRQNLHHCAALLEALDAVLAGRPDAPDLVATADSIFRLVPGGPQLKYANLLLARLHERLGDREAALRNVRARCWFCPASVFYLADKLRQEGRLAAALGDTAGALDAYARYLALRGDPEPSVQPQVDSVRLEIARLSEQRDETPRQ